jgi:ribokinase
MAEVVVIGSINIDKTITVPHLPHEGETILGEESMVSCGGKGANQAFAAAKLGATVTMLGAVGDDDDGRKALENLKSVGVQVERIHLSPKSTGSAVILVTDNGTNMIIVMPAANMDCSVEYLEKHLDVIKNADILLMQLEIPMESVKFVMENKRQTTTLILDPAPYNELLQLSDLKYVDILTPNETELQWLVQKNDEIPPSQLQEELSKILKHGVKNCIVTMGAQGGVLANNEEYYSFESVKVKAVDTTAAGDTFNGALGSRLAKGYRLKDAIAWANQAAAISVTRHGAQDSIPYEHEVNKI